MSAWPPDYDHSSDFWWRKQYWWTHHVIIIIHTAIPATLSQSGIAFHRLSSSPSHRHRLSRSSLFPHSLRSSAELSVASTMMALVIWPTLCVGQLLPANTLCLPVPCMASVGWDVIEPSSGPQSPTSPLQLIIPPVMLMPSHFSRVINMVTQK